MSFVGKGRVAISKENLRTYHTEGEWVAQKDTWEYKWRKVVQKSALSCLHTLRKTLYGSIHPFFLIFPEIIRKP